MDGNSSESDDKPSTAASYIIETTVNKSQASDELNGYVGGDICTLGPRERQYEENHLFTLH